MRPHLSLLIVVIALGSWSGALAASTSTSSGGGGTGSAAGGGAHGGGGEGGHSGRVGGHGALGGGFSGSGRLGSANHTIATRTALRTVSGTEPAKTHPGNPEHHHHHMFWKGAYPTHLRHAFDSCATLRLDREEDLVVSPDLLCGSAHKAPANLKTGRPAG